MYLKLDAAIEQGSNQVASGIAETTTHIEEISSVCQITQCVSNVLVSIMYLINYSM